MEQNLAQPPQSKPRMLDDDKADSSYEIALSILETMFYDQEHITQLLTAVERSKDPSKVVGTALGQICIIAYNKLNKADLGIDDMVWASDEGVIDSAIYEAVNFFAEANVELNPEAVATACVMVLKDSPIAGGPPQEAPAQGGAPSNMAQPQGVPA